MCQSTFAKVINDDPSEGGENVECRDCGCIWNTATGGLPVNRP